MPQLATLPMAQSPAFADLPDAIRGLLRDEANLTTARHVLDDARQDCLNRDEQLQKQRPVLGLLVPRKQREEHAAALAANQTQLKLIDAMLARVASARERLQAPLRTTLLAHLEHTDPFYRQGLRASRYHEHWRRGHALVADRLKGFLRDLRTAHAALERDALAGRLSPSEESRWAVANLQAAALSLDREIASLNHWAGEHATQVRDTPFAAIHLPHLDDWACVTHTATLGTLTTPEAAAIVGGLLAEFMENRQPSLDSLPGFFQAAADEHSHTAEKHLRHIWSKMLAYAECHLVTDAELEPTLADIEQRLSAAARQRIEAQAPRNPFQTER